MPAIGALDYPPPRFPTHAAYKRRFAAPTNVWLHTARKCLLLGIIVVVAFVQTEVFGQHRLEHSPDGNGSECGANHPLVVDVGARQRDREWDSATVGQNVAFCAEFSTIGRTGARDVPPLGAFTEALSSDAHAKSSPTFSW